MEKLKRIMLASAFAVLIANSAHAEQVSMFGIGAKSCAYWLSSPMRQNEGIAWLLGYWTGVNAMNQTTHLIGAKSDGEAIIAEVKKRCVAEPSTRMTDAVTETYDYFSSHGK